MVNPQKSLYFRFVPTIGTVYQLGLSGYVLNSNRKFPKRTFHGKEKTFAQFSILHKPEIVIVSQTHLFVKRRRQLKQVFSQT